MRIQLSLEFLIVFSFVLLVFIFMFALISNERSLGLGDQTFSQLQLQAQSIASAIDSAVQAGNGYSSSISIASLIGIVPYNVSITKNGVVILQAKVGKQIVKAVAYSTAKNVVSNLAYYYPQSNQYIIPISNGTMYIQNSFGNICIDYQCATQSNQAKSIFLSSQSVYAAEFSGPWSSTNYNSKSLIQASAPISGTNYPFTLTMWIKASNVQDFSHSWTTAVFSFSGYQAFGLQNSCLPNTCLVLHRCSSADTSSGVLLPYSIFNNKWYFIAVSVNYPNYYWQINNISSTDSNSNSYSSSTPVTIGTQFAQCDSNAFNGSIANVQVYSTNLLPSQIQALYQEGIGGAPIDLQHLVAWWPLNGNANDYSGNQNNGEVHYTVTFVSNWWQGYTPP
ncbi:MAG: LamG-like jellyroll fold domain-containing protein [Candidatus Micrarchaeia archaeon]